MTANEIAAKRAATEERRAIASERQEAENARETRRSNKAKEKNERRSQDMRMLGTVLNTASGPLTKLVGNDPEWYNFNPDLTRDAGNVSFYQPMSRSLQTTVFTRTSLTSGETVEATSALSLVCAIKVIPTVGTAVGLPTDPINVASRLLYSDIRSANAGGTNYDAVDLMVHLVTVDSAYSYFAFLMRAFGLLNYYTARNLAMPKVLFDAMNLDYDDLIQHIPDLRAYIDTAIRKLNTMKVPSHFSLMKRHVQIFSNIYTDNDKADAKGQMYLYTPAGFYAYTTAASDGAGMAAFKPFKTASDTLFTFADLVTYGNQLLVPIWTRQDAAIMSGDIIKKYGDNTFSFAPISDSYEVKPVYDLHMLMQIANTRNWTPVNLSLDSATSAEGGYNLTQNDGNLHMGKLDYYQQPDGTAGVEISDSTSIANLAGGAFIAPQKELINISNEASVEAKYILEYTRLTPVIHTFMTNADPDTDATRIVACYKAWGSEIPVGVAVYVTAEDNGLSELANGSVPVFPYTYWADTLSSNMATRLVHQLIVLSHCDWAPLATTFKKVNSLTQDFHWMNYAQDLQNFTQIDRDVIARMHEVAVLSEFSV